MVEPALQAGSSAEEAGEVSQPKYKKIHVIVNPAAGQDRPVLKILNSAFQPAGVDWDVFITKKVGDGRRLAQCSVEAGVDAVAVYGGDGTVMEVASGLMGADVPLAIFPGGTANVMSVELGIPADLAEACALVCGSASAIRTIDVGRVLRVNNPERGDYFFLTRVGMGLEVQVIEGADRETKDRMGWLAYALSAFRTITNPPVAHYRLTLDGREIESQGVTCVIANSGVITPNSGIAGRTVLSFAPNVSISDGLLDVIVIRATDLGGLLAVAASVVAGTEDAEPLQHWQAREVSVNTDPPQNLQCDGELIGQTPITVRVAPQALRVIVPEGSKTVEEQRGG